MNNQVKLAMGALCDPIEDQLNAQGLTLGSDDYIRRVQRWADEISSLGIHGLLSESERDRARKRLMKEIGKQVQPLPQEVGQMTDPNPAAPEFELWEAMEQAAEAVPEYILNREAHCYAAQIEALADAVVPEEPDRERYVTAENYSSAARDEYFRWLERQRIRAQLLDAARRAREAQP